MKISSRLISSNRCAPLRLYH